MGYTPRTSSTMMSNAPSIIRNLELQSSNNDPSVLHQSAEDLTAQFSAERSRAKESLLLSQVHQKKAYNQGRLTFEFEEGDLVVLNPHTLNLLRHERGRGKKFLMKYDGPFEVIQKISPVAYRLRMPASFGMHPVINIAHLEKYNRSPAEYGDRPQKSLSREDFIDLPEYDVEEIVAEKTRKQGKR